jgi:hypothetical protein
MLPNIYKFILFLLILTILSCSEHKPVTINNNPIEIAKEAPPRLFMNTQTRRLRVRETPDLEGTVLKVLQSDMVVEYLHDSTKFTTGITYNRKEYIDHWYKILAVDKTEGWVYAAFVKFLPNEENQKVVIQRETAELLEAANGLQPQITKKQKKELIQPINDVLVSKYRTFLSGLDKNSPSSVSQATQKFSGLFVGSSNARTCDAAYIAFHQFYERVLAILNRSNLSSYQHLIGDINRYRKATMRTDDYTRTLALNGFNFALSNGKVVLAEDVDFFYRIFYRECSSQMRSYMNQYQLEEPNFWLNSNELFISPKTLARWVLSWNYFVATYPDFPLFSDAKKRLEEKLNILLQGSAQSPAFSASTYVLQENYKVAYYHISDNYPESKIGRAFKEYLDILETNNWKSSTNVTESQNKIIRTFVLD